MNGVIYARYSSDNQREESIEGQVRECMEFAERQGVTVIGKYIDRAMSAKTDDRPDFQRMIKTAQNTCSMWLSYGNWIALRETAMTPHDTRRR